MHLHNIKFSFLKYKKYICEQYDIFDCLFLIGILVLISVIIDYFNQITWICNKFGMPIIICVLILIFIKAECMQEKACALLFFVLISLT